MVGSSNWATTGGKKKLQKQSIHLQILALELHFLALKFQKCIIVYIYFLMYCKCYNVWRTKMSRLKVCKPDNNILVRSNFAMILGLKDKCNQIQLFLKYNQTTHFTLYYELLNL